MPHEKTSFLGFETQKQPFFCSGKQNENNGEKAFRKPRSAIGLILYTLSKDFTPKIDIFRRKVRH
jgi:hypothetical protein